MASRLGEWGWQQNREEVWGRSCREVVPTIGMYLSFSTLSLKDGPKAKKTGWTMMKMVLVTWGSFINYVIRFLRFLSPPPFFVVTFNKYALFVKLSFGNPLHPPYCWRLLWMTPCLIPISWTALWITYTFSRLSKKFVAKIRVYPSLFSLLKVGPLC